MSLWKNCHISHSWNKKHFVVDTKQIAFTFARTIANFGWNSATWRVCRTNELANEWESDDVCQQNTITHDNCTKPSERNCNLIGGIPSVRSVLIFLYCVYRLEQQRHTGSPRIRRRRAFLRLDGMHAIQYTILRVECRSDSCVAQCWLSMDVPHRCKADGMRALNAVPSKRSAEENWKDSRPISNAL